MLRLKEMGDKKASLPGRPRGPCLASVPKSLNSSVVLGEKLIGKFEVRAARCGAFFSLVGGEVTGQSSRNLGLSLKLLSSMGGWEGLVLLKNSKVLLCVSL